MDSAVYLFSIAYMINIYISEVCKNSSEKQAIGNKILLFTVEIKTFLWDFLVWSAFLILYMVETFQFEGAIFYPFSSFWDWFMRCNVIYGFSYKYYWHYEQFWPRTISRQCTVTSFYQHHIKKWCNSALSKNGTWRGLVTRQHGMMNKDCVCLIYC